MTGVNVTRSGDATVVFGGPNGRELHIGAGDVVIIPAGVGLCNITQSPDLLIVGAYPEHVSQTDQYGGKQSEHAKAVQIIADVPPPTTDPVAGKYGPMCRIWKSAAV